jgi:hypothetical protein
VTSDHHGAIDQQISALFSEPVYGCNQQQKQQKLLPIFTELHHLHIKHCSEYANIFANISVAEDSFSDTPAADGSAGSIKDLSELPYLAVRLFKHLDLLSIEQHDIFKTLNSSGTSGQNPARIYLDKATSARQSKTLVKILQHSIGKQRLPMLIIDSPSVLRDKSQFSARGAGIQGLSFFGRDHTYALHDDMKPNWAAIEAFEQKYQGQPVLIFGFTFMLWLYFVKPLLESGRIFNFQQGIVLHSGGWKKLEAQKVDNIAFKQALKKVAGLTKVHNFYGMAEQVGSVFVECQKGHLHAPLFADVIVRDPFTLLPSEIGEQGILQVLSVLPTSYPGQSLLTEDLGSIIGIDDCPCGQKGKYFQVTGRLPKTEVRGCSDTHGTAIV